MRATINSTKHYVQFTQFAVASASVATHVHVDAVAIAAVSNPDEVREGAVIKAVFIELWLLSDTNASNSYVVTVEKTSGSEIVPTLSEMSTLMSYRNKKNILFTSQGLVGENGSTNPTPVLRQWIKIPKGKQRFGRLDSLRVNIAAIGATALEGCSFSTYKEYY